MSEKHDLKTIYGLLLAILAIVIIGIMAVDAHEKKVKKQFYDDFDTSRERLPIDVIDTKAFVRDHDFVEAIEIDLSKKTDDRYYSVTHRNTYYAKVTVSDDLDELPRKEKFQVLYDLDTEIRDSITREYEDTDYYRIYMDNQLPTYRHMEYRDKDLEINLGIDTEFLTAKRKYSFFGGNSISIDAGGHSHVDYDFSVKDGRVTNIHKQGYNAASYSTEVPESKTKTGSSQKTYDSYDRNKYKSAQDFADDKYEEFYDYEDDYEDEDEAYDAAEDYWNNGY